MWHTIITCNHESCELNEIKTGEYALMYTKLKYTKNWEKKMQTTILKQAVKLIFFYKIKKYKRIVCKNV